MNFDHCLILIFIALAIIGWCRFWRERDLRKKRESEFYREFIKLNQSFWEMSAIADKFRRLAALAIALLLTGMILLCWKFRKNP